MVDKLIGRTGVVAGSDFLLQPEVAVIRLGSSPTNDICIRDEAVSRVHASIVRRNEQCWIEDAGSTNGTFVNGERIKAERLRHLDVVTLGRRIDLIFIENAVREPRSKC